MLLQVIRLQESKADYDRRRLTMTSDSVQGTVLSPLGLSRPPHALLPEALPPASTRQWAAPWGLAVSLLQGLPHSPGRSKCSVRCCLVNSFATPWTAVYQAPASTGFPRQEYWSGLPFPYPGDLPHPGIEHTSPALAGRILYHWATKEAHALCADLLNLKKSVKYKIKQKSLTKFETCLFFLSPNKKIKIQNKK